jgi:nucleoside-diphosphate-sugar epimerase
MAILVTGAAGFVALNVLEHLLGWRNGIGQVTV